MLVIPERQELPETRDLLVEDNQTRETRESNEN